MLYLRAFGGLSLENGGHPLIGVVGQRGHLAMLAVRARGGPDLTIGTTALKLYAEVIGSDGPISIVPRSRNSPPRRTDAESIEPPLQMRVPVGARAMGLHPRGRSRRGGADGTGIPAIGPTPRGDGEDNVPVRHGRKERGVQPLCPDLQPLCVTDRADVAPHVYVFVHAVYVLRRMERPSTSPHRVPRRMDAESQLGASSPPTQTCAGRYS